MQVRQGQPTPSMIEKNGDIWSCIVCGKIASDPKTKVRKKFREKPKSIFHFSRPT